MGLAGGLATNGQIAAVGGSNKVTWNIVAGSPILANKLLATDANPAFQINGDGTINWGAGGASATDTLIKRNSGGQVQIGNGGGNDVNINSGGGVAAVGGSNLGLGNGVLTSLVLTSSQVQVAGTIKNTVAGNEATTATAGAIASPGNFQGFLIFVDHNGTSRKIPYFAT